MRVDADRVVLSYRHFSDGADWQDMAYPVHIDRTPCHYGGTRAWFICPAAGYGRRVAKLYLGRRIFACRHCYRSAYESQRENAYCRALSRAQKIRIRLGGSASLAKPFPEKPKGMHRRTYEWLRAKAIDAESGHGRRWPRS